MSYGFGASQPYGVIFYGDVSQLQGAVGQATMSFEPMKIKYGEVAQASEISTYRQLMSLRSVIFSVQMATFYISMFASGMLRSESSTISVERAQRNYNEAIREHGRGSEEARDALDSLTQAQIYYQRATTMSSIMTISLGLQAVSMGVSFIQAIPAIKAMITTLQTYNVVAAVSKALSGPYGWALLIGGVAVGVGAVAAINNINVNVENKGNLHSAFEEAERKATYELRRGG